jgi:hypothetical protein
MAKVDFVNELKALGFDPKEPDAGKVCFEYIVPVGGNIGTKILLGFEVGPDFPMNCPPGPHIKLLEGQWKEHAQNIHDSPFNQVVPPGWRYWSRPFKEWNNTERTVKVYLCHIKNLMMTV